MKTKDEVEDLLESFLQKHNLWQLKRRIVKDFIWNLLRDGRGEKKCLYCGKTFVLTRKDQKFCVKPCKKAFHNEARGKKG